MSLGLNSLAFSFLVSTVRRTQPQKNLNQLPTTYSQLYLKDIRHFISRTGLTPRISTGAKHCIKELRISKTYRGCRGGLRVQAKRNESQNLHISTIITTRSSTTNSQGLSNIINTSNLITINLRNPESSKFLKTPSNSCDERVRRKHNLKILHLNIRSLRNIAHFAQLKELNNREKFDIITISESWMNTTITSTEIGIDGYKLFRLDRLHKRGGGVCAYVRKELKTTVLKDLS